MKKQKIIFTVVNIFLALIITSIIFSAKTVFGAESTIGKNSNYFIVKYSEPKTVAQIVNEFNIDENSVKELPEFGAFRIKINDYSGGYDDNSYSNHGLEYFEPDYLYSIPEQLFTANSTTRENKFDAYLTPNDTYYSSQWALSKINAAIAWDLSTGSSSIIIANIDTGVDGTHPDLSGKVMAGYNYVAGAAIPANTDSDDHGHGTSTAGVSAAISNNSAGIAGVDWNAKIMPVKALDSSGTGYSSDIAYAIRYAADNGAKIINLSLGSHYASSIIESAINYAYNLGCVIVAASGNDGIAVSYPAAFNHVVAVGATDSSDNWVSWSDYGPELDLVAPGVSVYATADGGSYRSVSGTSISAPMVSGLASLIFAYNSNLSADEVISTMENNADKVSGMGSSNHTNYYGYGRINAGNSLLDVGSYEAIYLSQSAYPSGWSDDVIPMQVKFTNTGSSVWYNSGSHPVRLAVDKYQNESFLSGFNSSWLSTYRIANMTESSVAPGQTATFDFNIKIPRGLSPGKYRFYARMVAEGLTWFDNPDINGGAWWEITVPTPQAVWVSQSGSVSANQGDRVPLWVTFKNNNNIIWNNTYPAVRLATDKYQNESFLTRFKDSTWISDYRIADLSAAQVSPNTNTTYNFYIKIPNDLSPGNYKFYVRMVAENLSWFDSPDINGGAWWSIQVN